MKRKVNVPIAAPTVVPRTVVPRTVVPKRPAAAAGKLPPSVVRRPAAAGKLPPSSSSSSSPSWSSVFAKLHPVTMAPKFIVSPQTVVGLPSPPVASHNLLSVEQQQQQAIDEAAEKERKIAERERVLAEKEAKLLAKERQAKEAEEAREKSIHLVAAKKMRILTERLEKEARDNAEINTILNGNNVAAVMAPEAIGNDNNNHVNDVPNEFLSLNSETRDNAEVHTILNGNNVAAVMAPEAIGNDNNNHVNDVPNEFLSLNSILKDAPDLTSYNLPTVGSRRGTVLLDEALNESIEDFNCQNLTKKVRVRLGFRFIG